MAIEKNRILQVEEGKETRHELIEGRKESKESFEEIENNVPAVSEAKIGKVKGHGEELMEQVEISGGDEENKEKMARGIKETTREARVVAGEYREEIGQIKNNGSEVDEGSKIEFSLKESEEVFDNIKKRAEEVYLSNMNVEEKKAEIKKLWKEQESAINEHKNLDKTQKWRETGNTLHKIEERLEDKDLMEAIESNRIKNDMHRAQVLELQAKIAKDKGKSESDMEVMDELLANPDYKKMDIEDELNDLDLKIAEAKHDNDDVMQEKLQEEKREKVIGYMKENNIAPWIFKRQEKLVKDKKEKEDSIEKYKRLIEKMEIERRDASDYKAIVAKKEEELKRLGSGKMFVEADNELEVIIKKIMEGKY